MKTICIYFGVMTLRDVSVKHRYFLGEYHFELYQDRKFISTLDMKTYKLVKSESIIENLYKIERR